jgi:hypothetical protein
VYGWFVCKSAGLTFGDAMGLAGGVSPLGVGGCEATFARRAKALVGLPHPESLRVTTGASVVRHGEETVDGVRGGRRRLFDRCCGG